MGCRCPRGVPGASSPVRLFSGVRDIILVPARAKGTIAARKKRYFVRKKQETGKDKTEGFLCFPRIFVLPCALRPRLCNLLVSQPTRRGSGLSTSQQRTGAGLLRL